MRDFGLLQARADTEVLLRQGAVSVVGLFRRQESIVSLRYFNDIIDFVQDIKVVYRSRKFGKRPYFVCPQSDMDCIEVIFLDELIASSAFHLDHSASWSSSRLKAALQDDRRRARLVGTDGRKPARGRNRSRLQEALDMRLWKSLGKDAAAARAELAARSERTTNQPCAASPFSTRYALEQGYVGGEDDYFLQEYLSQPSSWVEAIPSTLEAEWPAEPMAIDQVPELNLVELMSWVKPGRVSVLHPGWWIYNTGHQRLIFILDWRREEQPILIIRGVFDPERPRWQRIEIARIRQRWYFRCPCNGRLYVSLYLRSDDFASRDAHRLVHVSQLASSRRAKAVLRVTGATAN